MASSSRAKDALNSDLALLIFVHGEKVKSNFLELLLQRTFERTHARTHAHRFVFHPIYHLWKFDFDITISRAVPTDGSYEYLLPKYDVLYFGSAANY